MSLVIKELLGLAENRLKSGQCLDARLDANILLCHFLKTDRSLLFTHMGDVLDDRRCDLYFELVDLRASGKPLQYILGYQEFMGIRFEVDETVLIPRQDTETLVEQALELLKATKVPLGGFEVLDLGCGSGAIGISVAYYMEKAKVTAVDISEKALEVARKNASNYKGCKGVQFLQGDFFEPFPKNKKGEGKKQFDMILSNPPYIPSAVIPTLQREVSLHEPKLALDGGVDGLACYRRIVSEAHHYLKKNGVLMMEIGCEQAFSVRALLAEAAAYEEINVLKDLTGKDRIAIATKKQKK